MTRLAKDLLSNLIGMVLDVGQVEDELKQMEHDYGESGEEAVQMVEQYLRNIQNNL